MRLLFCLLAVLLVGIGRGQEPTNLPKKGEGYYYYCEILATLISGVQLYLPYKDRIIPDYSMIHAGQFYSVDQNNDPNNTNDALWCQSANTSSNIGVWYYPDGTEVPFFDGDFTNSSAPSPVFSKRFNGQIALARRAGQAGYEGLYKCIVPNENGMNQSLVVGVNTTNGYYANSEYKCKSHYLYNSPIHSWP